jgi:hypothetical protein
MARPYDVRRARAGAGHKGHLATVAAIEGSKRHRPAAVAGLVLAGLALAVSHVGAAAPYAASPSLRLRRIGSGGRWLAAELSAWRDIGIRFLLAFMGGGIAVFCAKPTHMFAALLGRLPARLPSAWFRDPACELGRRQEPPTDAIVA